jgi:hypothetical protein
VGALHRVAVYFGLQDESEVERQARLERPWWWQPVEMTPPLAVGLLLAVVPPILGLSGKGWIVAQFVGTVLLIGSLALGVRRNRRAQRERRALPLG